MSRPALACALLAGLLCSCTDAAAPTQTIVYIDAEPTVRTRTAELRVRVESAPDGRRRLDQRVPWDGRSPLKIALAPLEGDASREFTVTATAYDRERKSVAWARLVTGFVAGEKRFVVLVIEDDCIEHEPACGPEQTCHRGDCTSAAVSPRRLGSDRGDAPTSIELLEPADVPVDGGADGGDAMSGEPPDGGDGGGGSGSGGTRGGSGNGGGGPGGATGKSGSGPGGSGGTGGDGESGQGGAGGEAGSGRACPTNSLCADVQLPDDFPGEATRVMIALYSNGLQAPVYNYSQPSPEYRYEVHDVTAFSAGDVVALTQDFTEPVYDVTSVGTFRPGTYYTGIIVFKSERTVRPLEGVDYWYFTPARSVLTLGQAYDLGTVRVELVPNLDDSHTPSDDVSGLVSCVANEPCSLVQGNVCCVLDNFTRVCQPSTALCDGPYVVRCDGPEDCPTGEQCCGAPGEELLCAEACARARDRICHTLEDCGGAACAWFEYAHCDVDDPATPGDDRARAVKCGDDTCTGSEFCCLHANTCTTDGCNGPGDRRGVCDGPEDCSVPGCYLGEAGQCCGSGCNSLGETPLCHTDLDCPESLLCSLSGTCCMPGSGGCE